MPRKISISLPDDLAAEVKEQLSDSDISAICQTALRAELDSGEAHAKAIAYAESTAKSGFERIVVRDDGEDKAFQGRKIGYADNSYQTAYLTPKGAIALWVEGDGRLYVYQNYEEFAAGEHPKDLVAEVAGWLGRRYVRELDI
jgi:post-segregation antitoxin (ccd killing protein)